ncbi:MAG: DUF3570 domain-containing protein [bacterium]|nr:DUF3570 domain-containing protein [bacterium]
MTTCLSIVVALPVLMAGPPSAHAAAPDNTATYALNMFSDVDGVNVYTHYIDYGLQTAGDLTAGFQWVHDKVVIPAIDAAPGTPEAIDGITSASRPIIDNQDAFEDFVKIRNSLQGSVAYKGANASYYVSSENDYVAQMVGAGYNRAFLDENFNLSGGASYSWDDIKPLESDGSIGSAYRNTLHWNLVVTQVMTPTSVLRLGLEYNDVRGQQHDPYRSVYVDGGTEPEHHPDRRSRRDAFLKVSKYLGNESSLKLDFRYYEDNWNISSQTYGVKLNQRVSRQVTFRYRYRYYTQVPAWFYRDDYRTIAGVDGYQTGDYRLGKYGAHLFGGHITWHPEGLFAGIGFLEHTELNFTYERYFNSNNFTANILETSLSVSF